MNVLRVSFGLSRKFIKFSFPIISHLCPYSNAPSERSQRLLDGLLKADRYSLAQSITLLESTNPNYRAEGQFILDEVMKYLAKKEMETGKYTFRIGLSGPPGAGKSTFIEAFGNRLTGFTPWESVSKTPDSGYGKKRSTEAAELLNEEAMKPHKVAVLAVDPSSQSTGGSLLADKTRMPELSHNLNAYIRPSPSGGNLGGVARATNESILLCEAAGFEIVLVETVGVGQSEFAAADMVDLFVLIIPPAGGDELQGIKRGIVEVADLVLVNKADGDLYPAARLIASEYSNALRYMRPRRPNWRPRVMLASSLKGNGLTEFWNTVWEFHEAHIKTQELQQNRKKQLKVWMWTYIKEGLWSKFKDNPAVCKRRKEIEQLVLERKLAPGPAAELLINLYHSNT